MSNAVQQPPAASEEPVRANAVQLGKKLKVEMIMQDHTGDSLRRKIHGLYPGAHVSKGHLSDILNGRVANPHPQVIVPLLLALGLPPEFYDITPETNWVAWNAYQRIKEHGWTGPSGSGQGSAGSRGRGDKSRSDQRRRTSRPKSLIAGSMIPRAKPDTYAAA